MIRDCLPARRRNVPGELRSGCRCDCDPTVALLLWIETSWTAVFPKAATTIPASGLLRLEDGNDDCDHTAGSKAVKQRFRLGVPVVRCFGHALDCFRQVKEFHLRWI